MKLHATLLVAAGLFGAAAVDCYHGNPPPNGPDPTQPPFPIPTGPCAGSIDPHCWPFAADHKPADAGTERHVP